MKKNYNKKVFIKTFGCQMNELDTKKMLALLRESGWTEASEPRSADLILFNTCTIRERSHHKAISEVGKAISLKRTRRDLIVGITGCVAQEEQHNMFKIYPELDLVVGPDQLYRLPTMLNEIEEERKKSQATKLVNKYEDYVFVDSVPIEPDARAVTSSLTIMKGCNNFCSFCIVPYVRGREVSRSPEDIISEIKVLEANGVREIMLLGQNVNSYGKDVRRFGDFPQLIRNISEGSTLERLRYISPHPKDLSTELIEEHRNNKLLCEHIHLPVQSGSTSVLERMNRKYTREDYLKKIAELRSKVPNIAISTDIIVGFAGETDDEFADTISLIEDVRFDGMFVFKYSERKGTAAAVKLKDDVPEKIKAERLTQVLELNETIVLQKHEKYVGTRQQVLVEGFSKKREGQITGRTRTSKIVNFTGDKDLIGKLVDVEITWSGANSLRGGIIHVY